MGSTCSDQNTTIPLFIPPQGPNKQKEASSTNSNLQKYILKDSTIIGTRPIKKLVNNKDLTDIAGRNKIKYISYFIRLHLRQKDTKAPRNLCLALRSIKSLDKFSLKFSFGAPDFVSSKVLEPLSSELKHMKSLNTLNLILNLHVRITKTQMESFCSRLKHLKSLTTLGLLVTWQPNAQGIESVLSSLRHLPLLSDLGLCFSHIDDRLLQALSSRLIHLRSLSALTLILIGNRIASSQAIESFFKNLGCLTWISSLNLDLGYCSNISNTVIASLSWMLSQLTLLSSLDLRFSSCSEISYRGMEHLALALKRCVSLTSLALKLKDCKGIDDQAMTGFFPCFAYLPALLSLTIDFQYCVITKKSLETLTLGLCQLQSLADLNINFMDCRKIEDKGMAIFLSNFSKLSNLSILSINFFYGISNKTIKSLSVALSHMVSLSSLSLQLTEGTFNVIEAIKDLAENSVHLSSLSRFEVDFDYAFERTSEKVIKKLFAELERLKLSFKVIPWEDMGGNLIVNLR